MKAFVLVKFTSLETRKAYNHLKSLPAVVEAYVVYGRYDAVVIIQAADLESIRRIVLTEIQSIPGVIETMPCVIVENEMRTHSGQQASTLKADHAVWSTQKDEKAA